MKKILLATTALVSLFAAAAHAEAPAVTVGGSLNEQAGFVDQKSAYKNGKSDYAFTNDTRINVKAQGKADNGLTYGGVIELLADVSGPNDNASSNGGHADKTFLFLESGFGRVEMGSNVGASRTLKVDASTFARATGGIDGDWYRYVNANVGTANSVGSYILTPELPLDLGNTGRDDTFNATKLTYYSPRVQGFQAGLSYIPNNLDRGTAAALSTKGNPGQYRDVFDFGANYTNQFNQIGVAASVTSQIGNASDSSQQDLRSYAVGADVNFSGFTLGGSYGNLDKSGEAKGLASNRTQDYWTLGGGYVQGPVGASVSYLNSERERNKFQNVSVGADYQLAPGLVPYAEISFFQLKPADSAVQKNEGTVFLLGTQLTF